MCIILVGENSLSTDNGYYFFIWIQMNVLCIITVYIKWILYVYLLTKQSDLHDATVISWQCRPFQINTFSLSTADQHRLEVLQYCKTTISKWEVLAHL